jgi:hypothetical protein
MLWEKIMSDKICTLLEIKKTHHVFRGNIFDARFSSVESQNPCVMSIENAHPEFLHCDFTVEQRQSKVFSINGQQHYVIWSPDLENTLGVPLSIFQNLNDKVAELRDNVCEKSKKICFLSNKISEISENYDVVEKELYLTQSKLLDSYRISIVFISLFVLSMLEIAGILRQ